MQPVNLPIQQKLYENIDGLTVQNDFMTVLQDCYQNEAGHIVMRPGLTSALTLGPSKAVDALYWWESQSKVLAMCNGVLYDVDYSDTSSLTATAVGGDSPGTGRCSICETADGANLIVAAGGKPVIWDGGATASWIETTDADIPDEVDFIVQYDRYIIANSSGTGDFYYSAVNDPTNWAAAQKAEAEGATDEIVGIVEHNGELVLIGSRSTEFWYDDVDSPFASKGIRLSRGCGAARSIIVANDRIWMIDNERNFVALAGRSFDIVSWPKNLPIHNMSTVSDAQTDVINFKGRTWILLAFPTEGVSYIYDYALDRWFDWGYYLTASSTYERYLGNCHCYIESEDLHLVGSRNVDGVVYTMSDSKYTDNGNAIAVRIRTGHIDHGQPTKRKNSAALTVFAKRGVANSDQTNPFARIRFRDDRGGWSSWERIYLGQTGEYDWGYTLAPMGQYYDRQYEIVYAHPCQFIFAKMVEEVEVLAA